ncbi:TIGR03084 family metal-binding protein [Zhengella mangrovi]|uniref:TIGR03084 family metal-binding protein n=1 Tax=Zhengella mangrovi TaxID=1982044 RepID=UPI00197C2752|nr:TIGR03084 family metal-binding protein [Zhengella mangrovi]
MSLPQARDFLAESEALHAAVAGLAPSGFDRPTQFKGWTIGDVLVHLHFWNLAADLSASDPAAFDAFAARVTETFAAGGGFRSLENAAISERGPELRDAWIAQARAMAARWEAMDPKARLAWVGPSMSARSSITARQMETWAHGFEVFDTLGKTREETDRIRNIVVLGVNTFGWSHQVHGLPVPGAVPLLELTAPSGTLWTFGEASAGRISGPAADFAAVVTQTRALADTALHVEGPVATTWMTHAQCFAGQPVKPPAQGSRFRQ